LPVKREGGLLAPKKKKKKKKGKKKKKKQKKKEKEKKKKGRHRAHPSAKIRERKIMVLKSEKKQGAAGIMG